MAATSKTSPSAPSLPAWVLPLAATILVAGSLAFWAMLGMVWLASRPAPQAPIVIYVPTAARVASAEQPPGTGDHSRPAAEDQSHAATD